MSTSTPLLDTPSLAPNLEPNRAPDLEPGLVPPRERFRAGREFDLVVFDRLPLDEQAALAELTRDPELYGVLRPRAGSGRTWKAVDRELALLLLTLAESGPLPSYVFRPDPERARREIETLVLDGVLERETASGFRSGPEALATAPSASTAEPGRLARLSVEALRHAATLRHLPIEEVAGRLYGFHHEPLLLPDAERLADASAVLAHLGAAPGTALAARLEQAWRRSADASETWILWTSRQPSAGRATGSFKLYISPRGSEMPRAFGLAVETLSHGSARAFKVGANAAGLARPDKLVVYFDTLETLEATARRLASALSDIQPQGVPFSAEIAQGGLLSWGIDPPRGEHSPSWLGTESWRLWVARRLASALASAHAASAARTSGEAGEEAEPWLFALDRLRREGVDTDRWTPSAALWSARAGE